MFEKLWKWLKGLMNSLSDALYSAFNVVKTQVSSAAGWIGSVFSRGSSKKSKGKEKATGQEELSEASTVSEDATVSGEERLAEGVERVHRLILDYLDTCVVASPRPAGRVIRAEIEVMESELHLVFDPLSEDLVDEILNKEVEIQGRLASIQTQLETFGFGSLISVFSKTSSGSYGVSSDSYIEVGGGGAQPGGQSSSGALTKLDPKPEGDQEESESPKAASPGLSEIRVKTVRTLTP